VDLALRGLLDVDASFAAMMQEAASGEEDPADAKEGDDDDRGSRDGGGDRGEAESKEPQNEGDVETPPSKAKRTSSDSSKGESVPLKRSKIPFDITNMTYDEYCCKHYSYAMEMYQKNKAKQSVGDGSQANPPLLGPPVPQQQLHMAQQSHQLQQQAMVMGPMGPVMGQMPMTPMGLGSYYPGANMGYGNMAMGVNMGHPMGMGMVPMYMNMPPGMVQMGMPQMGVNMGMPMGMGMMGGGAGAYGMGRNRGR